MPPGQSCSSQRHRARVPKPWTSVTGRFRSVLLSFLCSFVTLGKSSSHDDFYFFESHIDLISREPGYWKYDWILNTRTKNTGFLEISLLLQPCRPTVIPKTKMLQISLKQSEATQISEMTTVRHLTFLFLLKVFFLQIWDAFDVEEKLPKIPHPALTSFMFLLSGSVPAALFAHSEFPPSRGCKENALRWVFFGFLFFSSYRLQIRNDFRRLFSLNKEDAALGRYKFQCFQNWDFHIFFPNIIVSIHIFNLTNGCTLLIASPTK